MLIGHQPVCLNMWVAEAGWGRQQAVMVYAQPVVSIGQLLVAAPEPCVSCALQHVRAMTPRSMTMTGVCYT